MRVLLATEDSYPYHRDDAAAWCDATLAPLVLREDPGGTCLLCDEHVATSDAFIAHLKQAHGLTDDPGFQSSSRFAKPSTSQWFSR